MKNERESIFRFKQFALSNDRSAMKIGTDGVLLGAWCEMHDSPDGCRVLDVGCGTGVIGLMVAQRYPHCEVTCLDVDADAVEECRQNIIASPFASRVNAVRGDFLNYNPDCRYQLIISNPPYFKDSLRAPDKSRMTARHDDTLPLAALMRHASGMLDEAGRMALVLPVERDGDVEFESALCGLHITRRCNIFTVPGKPQRRTLWELALKAAPTMTTELFIHDKSGAYSKEYVSLLKDFYLVF